MWLCIAFYMGCWDPNYGPHAYVASALTQLAIPSASPSIFPSPLHYQQSSGCRLLWCSMLTFHCPLSLLPPHNIILGGKGTETQCPAMWLTMWCQVQPSTGSVYLVSEEKP